MVFSSPLFLFIFLPIVIAGYYLINQKFRNVWLLLVSLFFYAWGEPVYIFLMIASIIINYFSGLLLSKVLGEVKRKIVLVCSILVNLSALAYFKYCGFFVRNVNDLFNVNIPIKEISLPIGISFYTFQGISYVVDVYRNNAKCQKNILNLGLYISFFPQLIAGPIVRYEDFEKQILNRKESSDKFYSGVRRFIIGFSKKILIADQLSTLADSVFSRNGMSALAAWIGAVAFTLQIYFDFSGYSDMAIGLGKMFGFDISENFNYPYISKSIKEFWRRWHISLSTWFRDYVYIPLGGSRCKPIRSYLNLIVVFLLTGLWHGASWNFVAWGGYYVVFLIFERMGLSKVLEKAPAVVGRLYSILVIVCGWVLFRANGLRNAISYYMSMFDFQNTKIWVDLVSVMNRQYIFCLIAGIIFSMPIGKHILKEDETTGTLRFVINNVLVFGCFTLSICYMLGNGFSPFLYFRF